MFSSHNTGRAPTRECTIPRKVQKNYIPSVSHLLWKQVLGKYNKDSMHEITASGWKQNETSFMSEHILVHFIQNKFHDAKLRELNKMA